MGIIDDRTMDQVRARFGERLQGPVELRLYMRPSSGRLILPAGYGCPTCGEAQELVEALRDAAPEKIALEVIDITSTQAPVAEVPTITLAAPGGEPRIAWQGLPAGYEFATLIDAIERVSRDEPGLSAASLEALAQVGEDLEVMVFATPT